MRIRARRYRRTCECCKQAEIIWKNGKSRLELYTVTARLEKPEPSLSGGVHGKRSTKVATFSVETVDQGMDNPEDP